MGKQKSRQCFSASYAKNQLTQLNTGSVPLLNTTKMSVDFFNCKVDKYKNILKYLRVIQMK